MTATNGCIAGKGNDTIQFSVTGTITLATTLPQITDVQLTIKGPPSPGIRIDGGGKVQVIQVASGTTVNLKNLTISHGGGPVNGGGIENGGTLTITNSTFSDNFVSAGDGRPADGGGVRNFGTLTITNSTFSGNVAVSVAGSTAGIFNGGALSITNSTFFGNRGLISIGNFGAAGLKNTIVAGTTNSLEGAISGNCSGGISDIGYNISDDDTCGFAKTGSATNGDNVNPMLSPAGLADNGGPTQTIALLSGSPAIDAIPLSSCTDQDGNPLTTDQRGFPRPDNGEGVCDIGAYEFQDFAGTPGTKNCQGVSVSALAHEFGNIKAAASALHFAKVQALQQAIRAFCKV